MEKIKIFTAFSGYDSQCMALDKLGIDYELVGWSEIDKYAIQAHNAVYPQWTERNYGDITQIDWENVPDFDLFTYSFPCQDISIAGKQRGLQKGSETRSSLLWECQRAIEIKRPKYCLMENVAALVSEKFRPFFLKWERLMCRYGYTNYNKVLNAKDYGVPQNRERIFMVSIHNAEQSYYWPEPFKLEKRLKDVLEQNVDEKYYLSDRLGRDFVCSTNGHKDGEPKIIEPIGCVMRGRNPENPSERGRSNGKYKQRIEMGSNISNTITSVQKDSLVAEPQPIIIDDYNQRILQDQDVIGTITTNIGNSAPRNGYKIAEPLRIPQATAQGYVEVEPGSLFDGSYPNSKTRRGRVQDNGQSRTTLTANGEPPSFYEGVKDMNYRIRKLTPRECFRLMGVSETDIDKIQAAGISNSQQYKMAGNSIVVDVLEHIFRKMFVDRTQETQQLWMF